MLKNYVTLAYRNLFKNKVASGINIFGLSVAVACSIVAFLFVHSKTDNEGFQEHGANIFLVEYTTEDQGQLQTWGNTPAPLGPALAADFPQVVRAVRIAEASGLVRHGSTEFNQWIRFVDPGFLDMFTFPLTHGDPAALADPNAVILSEEAAIKYFGEENPLGQTLSIRIGDRAERSFIVRGVAAPYPSSTSLHFALLLAYENRDAQARDQEGDWSDYTRATFIQVEEPGSIANLSAQLDRYTALQQAADGEERVIKGFVLDNLLGLTRHSGDVKNTIAGIVPWAPVIVLSAIASFLLVLSCLNYMTIAIATASRRLKEIGIRKVMGSSRQQLIAQFLSENTLLCVLSLFLGIALAAGLLLPAFNNIAGQELSVFTGSSSDLWLFLAFLLVGIGLASGAYPAFYVSSFQPAFIIRTRQGSGSRRRFMQAMLAVQFVLAFITMIASLGLVLNAVDQQHRDWGYDRAHTLVIHLTEEAPFAVMSSEASQLPGVQTVSGSLNHVGKTWRSSDVHVDAEPMEATVFDVGPLYLKTLGLRLTAGQFFDPSLTGGASEAVVINETFAQAQGWTTPVGQTVRIDSTVYTVRGVVADFHYNDFSDTIDPALFRLTEPSSYRYLSMRLTSGTGVQTAAALEEVWRRLLPPDTPYNFFFQDTVFDAFYQETDGITQVFVFTAIIALLISCMGLLGLASQQTAARMKEVSIRKVLGATLPQIARLVNQRFLVLLVIAAVVATPISYFLLNALLDSIYTYRMTVGPSAFVISYGLVFMTALLTISTQIYQLAVANPAETLRNE